MTMPSITDEQSPSQDLLESRPEPIASRNRIRSIFKTLLKGTSIAIGMMIVILPALLCRLESRMSDRDECFLFWGQALALVPGILGKYLRKSFYVLTLHACALNCDIGFMTYFNDRRSEIGRDVYVGFGVGLGRVILGDGCMIGSRVSIINGGQQHTLGPDGRLTPFDRQSVPPVRIGSQTWLGEGAIIMANVGSRCIVGAGSVVPRPVADGYLVVGNPARPIRRLIEDAPEHAGTSEEDPRS